MPLQPLILKPRADRRLRGGHLWIYSNEVDTERSPLRQFGPGEQALVQSAEGRPLGVALVNPATLICARLVSRDSSQMLDASLLVHRLKVALGLRQRCFSQPCYRLVYGDSDGLPGLVVDRFFDVLVVQISSVGIEQMRDQVVEALIKVVKPTGILFKNDGKMREPEGLDAYVAVAWGEVPELAPLEENGVRFVAPVFSGQKTGWFYDHRNNRQRLQQLAAGKRVLDIFSYVGGWGVQAAAAGAESVTCIDSSAAALDLVRENARLNGVEERMTTTRGDAFACLKALCDARERFDIVVLDPPAFIQRRKDIKNGEQAYARANQLAMRLLNKDGLLISASCSMHLGYDRLVDIVRDSSRRVDRFAQIIEQGHQGADHPVLPAIPETDYLKSLLVRLLPTF